ncbi:MAG TPA: thrombospondin type 3 repeat-containing protein [Polyangiaceae bacterium]|nr:thrombospondin type 3 repeat-containing protein [Polyangiaceae bacterium]
MISNLDANANPTGIVYTTATKDNLGRFDLAFDASDLIAIESTGFYYNEVTGSLSVSPITLRALYGVAAAGEQTVFLNLITHLTFDRVKRLIVEGATFAAARVQAESELRGALGVVAPTIDVTAPGVGLNILGGDSDSNAYLLAVSTVLAKAAQIADPTAADATLQELLNNISLDLAQTGSVEAGRRAQISAALFAVDTAAVHTAFATRLLTLGSSASVPDLDRVLDQDSDGLVNVLDECPKVANPLQEDMDGDDIGDLCDDDRDGDGTANDIDSLPDDPHEWADTDGVPDALDNCPGVTYVGQQDTDQDGIGDACDEEDETTCPYGAEGTYSCWPDYIVLKQCVNTRRVAQPTCAGCDQCTPGSQTGDIGGMWFCDGDGHVRVWSRPELNSYPLNFGPLENYPEVTTLPLATEVPCWLSYMLVEGRW